jgi:hypothetical protein
MPEILVSVSAGLFGLVGAGLVGCLLGAFLWRRRSPGFPAFAGFTALVPAHQEEGTLPETLRSLRVAAEKAGISLRILVGADSCTDRTAVLGREAGAEVAEYSFQSKWKTVAALAERTQPGEWVALVDAGATWPDTLLTDLRDVFRDPALLAVAPAYFPRRASFVERSLWRSEARWKLLENLAGGPVSVHGATVFFRAEALRGAYATLARYGRDAWLTDDVALPFAARVAFPGGAIRYWCPRDVKHRISDEGLRESGSQLRRRVRMAAGNLEWALTLFPAALIASPAAACVALRRVFRIFWAYWVLCLLYAVCRWQQPTRESAIAMCAALAVAGAVSLAIAGKGSLVGAAIASIGAPWQLPSVLRRRSRSWG